MRFIFAAAVMATAFASSSAFAAGPGENKAFCRQSGSAETQCLYDTMAQCEQSKRGNTDQCMPRVDAPGTPSTEK
jgi:hypothetical protein